MEIDNNVQKLCPNKHLTDSEIRWLKKYHYLFGFLPNEKDLKTVTDEHTFKEMQKRARAFIIRFHDAPQFVIDSI